MLENHISADLFHNTYIPQHHGTKFVFRKKKDRRTDNPLQVVSLYYVERAARMFCSSASSFLTGADLRRARTRTVGNMDLVAICGWGMSGGSRA